MGGSESGSAWPARLYLTIQVLHLFTVQLGSLTFHQLGLEPRYNLFAGKSLPKHSSHFFGRFNGYPTVSGNLALKSRKGTVTLKLLLFSDPE